MFLRSLTTEAMGTGGLRANFLSWNDKGNAGAKTAKSTSAAKAHRRVLVARSLIFIQLFQCQPIKSGNSRNSRFSRPINRTFQPKCQKVVSLFSFLRCPTAQNCHRLTNKFLNFQSYKSKTF